MTSLNRQTSAATDGRDGDDGSEDAIFDVIVVVHYLHRPLLPRLLDALAAGGVDAVRAGERATNAFIGIILAVLALATLKLR